MTVMRQLFVQALGTGVIALALAGCSAPGTPAAAVSRLAVEGRSSATPWVAASGQFVAVAWGATTPDGKTDVFLATSGDGGTTFTAPVQVNTAAGEARLGGELPPRVAVVPSGSGGDPDVVVLWTARGSSTSIKLARSRDGGRTFEAPVELQAADAAGDRGWPALAIDARGVAHAVWLDHRGMAKPGGHDHAGRTSETGVDGTGMAQGSALYYAASSTSVPAAEHEITRSVCYCCKTALATGKDGELLAAWRHVYAGNMRDMAFTTSRDGGRTFASLTRVSEDGWSINGCPDDGPSLTVDAAGTIHMAWPSVIDGPEPQGAIFYASSTDGRTFTPRQRVPTLGSPKPAHPQIVAGPSGKLAIAWDEVVDGRRTAAVRTLSPGATDPFGPVTVLGEDEPAVYPVLATTRDGLIAVWTSRAGETSSIRVKALSGIR